MKGPGNKDFISILNSPEKAEALKEPLANSPAASPLKEDAAPG